MDSNKIDTLIYSAVKDDEDFLLSIGADQDEHIFSKQFQNKMQNLYVQPENFAHHGRARYWRLLAAALAAALLVGTISASAFWPELLAFFQSVQNKYTELRIIPEVTPRAMENEIINGWGSYWYPYYLPEGYAFLSASEELGFRQLSFSNLDDGRVLNLSQGPGAAAIPPDSEYTNIEGVTVSDYETYAAEHGIGEDVIRILSWSDGTTAFVLMGQASFDELVKTAELLVYAECD